MALKVEASSVQELHLKACTARDLMTPTVVSIQSTATLQVAVQLLLEKNLSALPVVDENEHPVGVLSRSDVVAYDFKQYRYLQPESESAEKNGLFRWLHKPKGNPAGADPRHVHVRDLMTPVIFSVSPETPAGTVVDALLTMSVHRLFVTDVMGDLLGVISATDVLRHLHHQDDPKPGSKDAQAAK